MVVSVSIYAAGKFRAAEIIYDASNGASTNVNDALDELYNNLNAGGCATNVVTPTLGDGMIPVTISDDGIVTYANTISNWYNYCDKKWANAVILSSGSCSERISDNDERN